MGVPRPATDKATCMACFRVALCCRYMTSQGVVKMFEKGVWLWRERGGTPSAVDITRSAAGGL